MIIIGADYHPGFQQIAYVDSETGELQERRLQHREEAEKFYRELAVQGMKVRVGMEASGHARWFERLLGELQLELWIGDAAEIRTRRVRKQKTDRQDAQLILRWMLKEDFPRIWVASWENRDLRQLLWHRHRMVQARTPIMNQLQAVALNEGLRSKKRLWRLPSRKGIRDEFALLQGDWVRSLSARRESRRTKPWDACLPAPGLLRQRVSRKHGDACPRRRCRRAVATYRIAGPVPSIRRAAPSAAPGRAVGSHRSLPIRCVGGPVALCASDPGKSEFRHRLIPN